MLPVVVNPGDKFKHWTVIKRVANYKRDRAYLCRCDCGFEKILPSYKLRSTKENFSCKKCSTDASIRHGDTTQGGRTTLYIAWDNMKRRCQNQQHPSYASYGGRGITVCKEWSNDYGKFKEWSMLNGWRKGLSLDRIDNNKGYSPDNCRWTTQKEQCNNTRRNKRATINGETQLCTYWLKVYGVSDWFVRDRMKKYNITFAEAIQMPRKRKKGIYA